MTAKRMTTSAMQQGAIPPDPEDPNPPPERSIRIQLQSDPKTSRLLRKVSASNATRKLKKV